MPDQAFQDRLNRINAGRQWAPEGIVMPTRKQLAKRRGRGQLARNAAYPVSIAMAFALGMATVVIARWVRFQMFAGSGGGDVLLDHLLMDMAMSVAVAFVIRMMTDLKSPIHLTAKSFGITACALTMHMAVHRFPDQWALLFNSDWVRQVMSQTDPNGILFFTFGG